MWLSVFPDIVWRGQKNICKKVGESLVVFSMLRELREKREVVVAYYFNITKLKLKKHVFIYSA